MAKKMKKVNPKEVAKTEIMQVVAAALENAGYSVKTADAYGMTKGTLVVNHPTCDVQVKPITPKVGVTRYEMEEEEEG